MKLKSLLFGSAAVLAAGTGTQAADLPTAEPVEYVRICDAFGTGYYYIPGTDTCLNIGGRVRAESHYVNGDNFVTTLADAGSTGGVPQNVTGAVPVGFVIANTLFPTVYTDEEREFNNWTSRVSGLIDLDARTQTDFGLIRTYIAALAETGNGSGYDRDYGIGSFALDEAFIQIANDWGTYTAGFTGSRFNYIGSGLINARGVGVDANDPSVNQFAWTLAGGNGFSATIAIEDPQSNGRRRNSTVNFATFTAGPFAGGFPVPGEPGTSPFPFGSTPGFDNYEGQEAPDLVVNARVDQGWGAFQVMGAVRHIHDEDNFEQGFPVIFAGFPIEPPIGTDEDSDGDGIGWAAGAGITLNLPFAGLQFNGQGGYSEGAINYVTGDPISNRFFGGITTGDFLGPDADDDSLTEAWNFHGNLNGDITPTVGFVLAGSYTEVDSAEIAFGGIAGGGPLGAPVVLEGIDYSHWGAAANLNWHPVEGLSFQWEAGYGELEIENSAAQRFALSNFTTTEDQFEMYRTSFRVERAF